MTNKEKIKNIIKQDFDKNDNYNYILEKIGEKNMKKININKILISSSLVILILLCGIILFTKNSKELKNNNQEIPVYNNIVINKLDNVDNLNSSTAGYINDVAGGFYEKAIQELEVEYSFINDLFVFGEKTKNQRIGEYRFDEGEPQGYFQGYFVIYTDDTEKKGVEIFFSKTLKTKIRDVGPDIILEELDDSLIMNTKVKIVERGNSYIAFFSAYNVYFDIEVNNTSQEELINLIEKILQ